MSCKIKKDEGQPGIENYLSAPKQQVQKGDTVQKTTPKETHETKRKRSPPSKSKPGKKINLELDPTTSDKEEEEEEAEHKMPGNGTNEQLQQVSTTGDEPGLTPDQLAFEDRLITKLSQMMSAKFQPLEDSIRLLTECQKQHSSSIQEISKIHEENKALHKRMDDVTKENITLRDRVTHIENRLLENNIILRGVPEEPWEIEANLWEKVIKILAYTVDAAEYADQLEVVQAVRINKVIRKGAYSASRT